MSGPNGKQYVDAVTKCLNESFELDRAHEDKELQEAIGNSIFDRKGPRTKGSKLTEKQKFVAQKLFRGMHEIYSSQSRLRNIEVYIRRFPYSGLGVSRMDYLRYHIENYLNEVYILKTRLETYSKVIARAYKKSDSGEDIEKRVAKAGRDACAALDGIVQRRGEHVHENRYTDDDIERLSTLELLSTPNTHGHELYEQLFVEGYKKIRKKWRNAVRVNMKNIDELIDRYFRVFLESIVTEGAVVLPKGLK